MDRPLRGIPIRAALRETLWGNAGGPAFAPKARVWKTNSPHNRVRDLSRVAIIAHLSERLGGYLSLGADYHIAVRLNERLSGRAQLAGGIRLRQAVAEALSGSANGFAAVQVVRRLGETLGGGAQFAADIFLSQALTESLKGRARLGADIFLAHNIVEELAGEARLGADVYLAGAMYESLNGYVSGGNVREWVMQIAGSIPPGSELVIDSDNYTVLLDRQNAIHRHSGDWITVGRPTVDLTLSAAANRGIDWEVFYIARFL